MKVSENITQSLRCDFGVTQGVPSYNGQFMGWGCPVKGNAGFRVLLYVEQCGINIIPIVFKGSWNANAAMYTLSQSGGINTHYMMFQNKVINQAEYCSYGTCIAAGTTMTVYGVRV
jgi:hypothetical protein